MRFSTYVRSYLDFSGLKPRTVGTFFAYRLRGAAKSYSGRYANALIRSLEWLEERGHVRRVRSVCGGTAWERTWPWNEPEDALRVDETPEPECSAPSHDAGCPRCRAMTVCEDPECPHPGFHEGPLCDDCLLDVRACRIGGGL